MTETLRIQLHDKIQDYFNSSELRSLCFSLGLDYDDDLPGATKSEKIISLITLCQRKDKLLDLIKLCKEQRPHVSWEYDFDADPPLSSSSTQNNTHRFEKIWLPLIIAIIGLVGVVFTAVLNNLPLTIGSPTPTTFDYQIRVEDQISGEAIKDAKVTIDVSGQAPKNEYTDSNGVARIFIDTLRAGEPGKLMVEMQGYITHVENITLTPDTLPVIVRLEFSP